MPVALSEWRVRIGTFIHRIKEWVVREMREELLKERIQRLRVLWKRLKAKEDDSEGGSQDHKTKQAEGDSTNSSLVNQQVDCNAEPCTKMGQDSPQPCYVGSDTLHHESSGRTVTSQTDSASLSTPTHPTSGLCLSHPFLSSFLSPCFYCCFPLIFLLFSSLCLPLSPGFGIPVSVSLSFLVVFPFLLSLFLSTFLPFSRRERSFGECHTSAASPSNYGSGSNQAVDEQLPQQPNLQELMLVTAGDVELNPGPREGSIDSALQEKELVLLAKEVPGNFYDALCIGLGFSYTEGQNVLTKRLLDIPGALIELFCRWKIRQRDGTDCRAVLGEILKDINMGSLQTKLLEGGYLKSDKNVPSKGNPQEAMTEEQVLQCAEDLKSFYRERMCRIKPDPLDFDLIVEFEQLYTNLVLLRRDKGVKRDTLPLDYQNLFTTKVCGVLPKRLLVEGEGGVGKTTLCSKIAWDWTEGCEEYKQFNWVLVIPLRDVIKGQTIGDCMKNYLNENNTVRPEQIEHFMISQPSKVLIVLDGFDEYDGDLSNNDRSGISQVLRLDTFKQCTVLVTTRPWRAHEIKRNKGLCESYAFIAVEGFSAENVSAYIGKYFVKDVDAGNELIRFIEVNDVIKENMVPFPIYVAMLCILWQNIDSEKRETIRRLKTFSQLFEQMIIFLIDHYVSKLKAGSSSNEEYENSERQTIKLCLTQIGSVTFNGLFQRKMVFTVEDFSSCIDAMTICCRIGVLSREQKPLPRLERSMSALQATKSNVVFPHKLFQEYIAALYLACLYEDDCDEYRRSLDKVMEANVQEFRYLLYFTAAQVKEIGLEIVEMLQEINRIHPALMQDIVGYSPSVLPKGINHYFLVDVTFEAYDKDIAKAVGQRIFAEKRTLEIDRKMSAHTVSGYMFIMEQHQVETLELRRDCGPTVSRDIADLLSSPTSLTTLNLLETNLDDEFYSVSYVSKRGGLINIVQELHIDHRFLGGLHKFDTTIKTILPNLKRLRILTLHTVTPVMVKRLAHARLEELSIERALDPTDMTERHFVYRQPVPLIGEPVSLEHLFSESFPQLTSLVFKELMIGNTRTRSILQSLKKHRHLKSLSIFACFTDNEVNPLAEQINAENRIKVTLQHDEEQSTLEVEPSTMSTDLLDAICHRTSVCKLFVNGREKADLCFPDLHGKEVDSKIHTVKFDSLNVVNQQSGSCYLGRFLSLLPRLTDLTISSCSFHDDFYREIAERALSSQIDTVKFDRLDVVNQQSGSRYLGRFLSLLPRLTHLKIFPCSFHDDFCREIAERALSSQIQTVEFDELFVPTHHSELSYLGRFLSLLPRLTHLKIFSCYFHDDFYREIAKRASSSQIHTLFLGFQEDPHRPLSSSAFKHLARFICCLPCLANLTITDIGGQLDDFFIDFASMAASSKIHTLCLGFQEDPHGLLSSSAFKHLARFICCLPRLANLTITNIDRQLDDFFTDFASMAASSKIHTLVLGFERFLHVPLSSAACKHLVRFICCLPCLTNITITCINLPRDDFFIYFASMAASSKSPYFMERKHVPLLDKYWPRWRELQSPAESSSSAASTYHSEVEPSQHQGSLTGLTNLPHHQLEVATLSDSSISVHSDSGLMNLSTTYPHRAHTESIRITSEQVDLTTRQHLDEFDRYLESYLAAQNFTHVPSHSLGHSSDSDTRQQYGSSVRTNTPVLKRQEQPTQMEPNTLLPSSSSYINSLMFMHGRGSSIGRKPLFEHYDDHCWPSTSGITVLPRAPPADTDSILNDHILVSRESSDDSGDDEETTEESVVWDRMPPHSQSKRIHGESSDDTKDDKEATEESVDLMDARPRKGRAKIDRDPTSP